MNSTAKKITLSAGLGLLLFAGGCFDTTEDFTVNPDGSGKVVHECTFQSVNLNVGNDRARLIEVITQLLPFIGYPRTLNALRAIDEVAPAPTAVLRNSEGQP